MFGPRRQAFPRMAIPSLGFCLTVTEIRDFINVGFKNPSLTNTPYF
jgi:hypothetical protein